MTDTQEPAEPEAPPRARPALTLIHVLWLTTTGGCGVMAYQLARDTSMPVRVLITIVALIVGLAVTHVLAVFIVIFVIIPRLKPGSNWSREVGSYMATNTPEEW